MKMTRERHRFIEDMGRSAQGWGLSRTTGRIYAYLLVLDEAASLDDIVRDLGVAKSGASVATRQLALIGLAKSQGERGTRRRRFTALYAWEAMLAARSSIMGEFVLRLREASRVAAGTASRRQLRAMADRIERLYDAVSALIAGPVRRRRA